MPEEGCGPSCDDRWSFAIPDMWSNICSILYKYINITRRHRPSPPVVLESEDDDGGESSHHARSCVTLINTLFAICRRTFFVDRSSRYSCIFVCSFGPFFVAKFFIMLIDGVCCLRSDRQSTTECTEQVHIYDDRYILSRTLIPMIILINGRWCVRSYYEKNECNNENYHTKNIDRIIDMIYRITLANRMYLFRIAIDAMLNVCVCVCVCVCVWI